MIGAFFGAGRVKMLTIVGVLVMCIAIADWYVGNRASLGVFYIVPMMLGALELPWAGIVALALVCSSLRSFFDIPSPRIEIVLRFVFASLAYACCGLFISGLIGNRELVIRHLANIRREQHLREEAEEQLQTLVESSPAAILTVDGAGTVLAANDATNRLFMLPGGETIKGHSIYPYLPILADALQFDPDLEGLRTAAQCQGRRANGEIFVADTWFSSYVSGNGKRLAAIVVDSSDELRDREEQNLRQLMRGNRIATAAVCHEVRNLCGAIAVISANLKEKHGIGQDVDFKALTSLVTGLERVTVFDLQLRGSEVLEEVELQAVLDDLRIVIEPDWREIDGTLNWHLPAVMPHVLGDRSGLLQAFMNLVQNSRRAVLECPVRELSIVVSTEDQRACVRFLDSGPGISSPARLFEPFQPGADGTGLGLYVSRAVLRSYGGDLRFEASPAGSCFAIELQLIL